MERARDRKAVIASSRRQAVLSRKADTAVAALDLVANSAPAVASMLGRQGVSVGRLSRDSLTPQHFHILVRAMHIPSKRCLNLGVKHKRLICLGAKLFWRGKRLASSGWASAAKKHYLH